MSDKEDKGQLTLFSKKEDYEKAFKDGEIVAQTWEWIGSFDAIFPFWQVRHSEILHGERHYFCCPVPYGTYPNSPHWFTKNDIVSTGLSWRIPTFDELNEWCKKHYEVSEYVKGLNQSINNEGHWRFKHLLPYQEETELVKLLKTTGIDYLKVTRKNFDEMMKPLLEKKQVVKCLEKNTK